MKYQNTMDEVVKILKFSASILDISTHFKKKCFLRNKKQIYGETDSEFAIIRMD